MEKKLNKIAILIIILALIAVKVTATSVGTITLTLQSNTLTWSSQQSSTPTNYSSSTFSEFNITWQDNAAVSKVLIEINTTGTAYNYTMTNTYGGNIYNYSTVLPAGTFTWKSYANDTTNNWNSSSSWSFTIGKTTPTIHLALNQSEGNKTYTYPEAVNVTEWVEVPGGETGNLYKNNTLISGFTDSDDFTSYNSSKWLNDTTQGDFIAGYDPSLGVAWKINDSNLVGYNLGGSDGRGQNLWYKTKLNLPFNVTWYAKIPNMFNWDVYAVCLVDTNDTAYREVRNQTCFAYIDDSPFKWGILTFNKGSASWNYSSDTDATFSVFKEHELRWNGTLLEAYRDNNLLWSGSLGDFPTTDMYLVFLISHNGAHGTDTYFYIDNITIRTVGETREIRTLTPAHYNYTFVYNGNENYSSSSVTYYAFVNKAPTSVNLYINGSASNQTSSYLNSILNTTAVSNVSSLYVQLWRNGTLLANDTTAVTDITKWGAWSNNFTVQVLGNENYLSSESVTLWWNISKGDAPLVLSNNLSWSGTYPALSNTTGSDCPSEISCDLYRNNSLVNNPHLALLGAGTHTYVYNTSGNENYSSNSTSNTLTINPKNASVKVYPITQTITYPQSVTEYCTDTSSTVHCQIYRNDTLIANGTTEVLGVGVYDYLANISDNQNYTDWNSTSTLTINKASSPLILTNNISWNGTYPAPSNTTGSGCPSQITCNLYRNDTLVSNPNNVLLGVGSYNYVYNTSGNENYFSNSTSNTLTISAASRTVNINFSQTSSVTYETLLRVGCIASAGSDDGSLKLFKNGTDVTSTEKDNLIRLPVGTWQYVCNITQGVNYTSATATQNFVINQKNASVKVYPITQNITYPQSVTEYCTVNSSLVNCSIFRNGSQIVNGTSEILGVGVYSYLANISDTSNYTNTQDSSTLTINRATSSCSLSGITNHTYGLADTVVCSCTGEGTIHLYQNNTLRDAWNNTARMYENATYIWVCNMTDINYTDASTSKTQTINITNTTTGTYTNNSVSITANTTTTINVTTSSATIITLDVVTTSNVTNSFISVTEYNSTPSGITNLTTIGIYGLNKFFDISVGPSLNSSLRWAVVNISYNESEVNASNLDESSLRIYYYNSTISNWSSYDTPFGGVNTISNYVWANTTHFSYYSLGGLLTNGQSCNSNSNCSSGYCVHNICRSSSPYCGDGYCDSGETTTNCPTDCPPSTPYAGGGGGTYVCTENWTCTDWSTCILNKQTRVCSDKNKCGTTKSKPAESQSCSETVKCTENWSCTDWSACAGGTQSRTCTDSSNCGTTDKKPILSQSCVAPTPAPSISSPTPTTPLGLGVGLIAVIAFSAIIIFIILKRKKIKKKRSLTV